MLVYQRVPYRGENQVDIPNWIFSKKKRVGTFSGPNNQANCYKWSEKNPGLMNPNTSMVSKFGISWLPGGGLPTVVGF